MNSSRKKGLALLGALVFAAGVPGLVPQAPLGMGAPVAMAAEEPVEGAPLASVAVDPVLRQLGSYRRTYENEVYDNGQMMLQRRRTEIHLSDGDNRSMLSGAHFPNLKAALDRFNGQEKAESSARAANLKEEAQKEFLAREGRGFHAYTDFQDIVLRRADTLALSFLATYTGYTGGAHGSFNVRGINFDAVSGEELALSDVMNVSENLSQAVIEALRAKYQPAAFFDSMEETVTKEIAEGTVCWVLEPRGVTFFFNQYDIAPYASGLLSATILYDERPGFFREKYNRGPASYGTYLLPGYEAEVVLRDSPDGHHDKLMVSDYDGKIRIDLNGMAYEDEYRASEVVPVLVHRGDGRNFLYVDCLLAAKGEREMRVYDLNGGRPVRTMVRDYTFQRPFFGSGEGFTREWLLTDPYEFRIELSDNRDGPKTHVVQMDETGQISFG
ncbi:MAG: DUF3298 domain-containing protein [Schwartzia sp.]|nr:DUF3298 domain-containing protein [Schwartzia sp. (in: firmicutes)]